MMQNHFCEQHQSKFYKNERTDKMGQMKVWYSHKLIDGKGFCLERDSETSLPLPRNRSDSTASVSSQGMLMCNAMNNAVALASTGKIQVDQIGAYYQRILSELMRSIQ